MHKQFHIKTLGLLTAYLLLCSLFCITACKSTPEKKDNTPSELVDPSPENLRFLNEAILKNPDDPALYNQRAALYVQMGNTDSAFRDISRALTNDSTNADYLCTLSDVYMLAGMVQNALAALEKALLYNPKSVNALLKKAELHLYFDQFANTLQLTEEAIKIDGINPKAYFIRGMCFKLKGDTTNAIRNIQKTVEIDQEYYHAYIQLGLLFAAKGDILAADYYNNALNLDPKSVEAYYGLGMFYQDNGFINEALSAYTNLLLVDSTYRFAHFNLGYIHLVELKLYSEAIKYFNNAIRYAPDYVEAYYNRGYSFELLGDINNARGDYKKALELRTNYQLAIEGLNRLDKK